MTVFPLEVEVLLCPSMSREDIQAIPRALLTSVSGQEIFAKKASVRNSYFDGVDSPFFRRRGYIKSCTLCEEVSSHRLPTVKIIHT